MARSLRKRDLLAGRAPGALRIPRQIAGARLGPETVDVRLDDLDQDRRRPAVRSTRP